MRVVVVGSTGVLGRRVVPLLSAHGHQALATARSQQAAARLPGFATVVGDVWDEGFLRAQFTGADAVLMLATSIPRGSSAVLARSWRTNTRIRSQLAPTVARTASECGVGVLVQESVMYVYADGGSRPVTEGADVAPVLQTKACLIAESAALGRTGTAPETRSVVLRFAGVVAAESDETRAVRAMAAKGRALLLGDPDGYTTFVHADDAAAAIVHALSLPTGVYNVGAEAVTKAAWLQEMADHSGRAVLPAPDILRRALPRVAPTARALARSIRLDSSHLMSTGWTPEHASSRATWAPVRARI